MSMNIAPNLSRDLVCWNFNQFLRTIIFTEKLVYNGKYGY
jgi:hypothetical protein